MVMINNKLNSEKKSNFTIKFFGHQVPVAVLTEQLLNTNSYSLKMAIGFDGQNVRFLNSFFRT